MSAIRIYILGLVLISISACVYNNEEDLYEKSDCETEGISYTAEVIGILENNGCISCHNTTNPGGSINLDNYTDVKIYVDNGRLLGSIKHSDGFKAMPQGSPSTINQCSIDQIEAWIYDGAQNN
jgi:hypothetical protein